VLIRCCRDVFIAALRSNKRGAARHGTEKTPLRLLLRNSGNVFTEALLRNALSVFEASRIDLKIDFLHFWPVFVKVQTERLYSDGYHSKHCTSTFSVLIDQNTSILLLIKQRELQEQRETIRLIDFSVLRYSCLLAKIYFSSVVVAMNKIGTH
jgi:hypothetical protein